MDSVAVVKEPHTKKNRDIFSKRIHEIDFARGFLIILVLIDHIMFCFQDYGIKWWGEGFWLYEAAHFYVHSYARDIIQPICLMAFCFISGISCAFSRNNRKRSIVALIIAVVLAALTNIGQLILNANNVDSLIRIDLNIIAVLGICIFSYSFIDKLSWKANLAVILFGFIVSSYINPIMRVTLLQQFGGITSVRPGMNYGIEGTPKFYMPIFWEYPIVADIVPLFPYMMFFFSGTLFSYFVYKQNRKSLFPRRFNWERPVCFLGRHTMVIYLSHVVVIFGIFMLINFFITGAFL